MKNLRIKASLSLAISGVVIGAVSGLVITAGLFIAGLGDYWKYFAVTWGCVVVASSMFCFFGSYVSWRKQSKYSLECIISANSSFTLGLIK